MASVQSVHSSFPKLIKAGRSDTVNAITPILLRSVLIIRITNPFFPFLNHTLSGDSDVLKKPKYLVNTAILKPLLEISYDLEDI